MARYGRRRFAALLLGCSLALPLAAVAADGALDPRSTDPLKLLEILRRDSSMSALTIREHVEHWVPEKDLPKLMLLLDSTEPCASVMHIKSSFWPGMSTVGEQAAFMIQGFRAGIYPPDLHSGRMAADAKDEIRAWWAARKPK